MQNRTPVTHGSREGLYLILFAIAFVVGACVLTWYEVRYNTTDSALETTIAIIRNMEAFVVVSAAAVYIIVEGGTMLAERYLRRRYAEGVAEGVAQGVAQGKDEANETWKRILDAYPDKTAAELRRMVDRGELPTDA